MSRIARCKAVGSVGKGGEGEVQGGVGTKDGGEKANFWEICAESEGNAAGIGVKSRPGEGNIEVDLAENRGILAFDFKPTAPL